MANHYIMSPESELCWQVGDWEKLSSARERHALDVQKERLEEAAQKEQRKQERAAKRAARKVAAEVPRGPEEAVSRSTLTAPSAANSRSPTFTSSFHFHSKVFANLLETTPFQS